MKNNLKRIAIILPVIALLLAFLAVPAAADGIPTVTGIFEPRLYTAVVDTNEVYVDVMVGEPFGEDGFVVDFRYKVTVDLTAMYANGTAFTPGDYLGSESVPEYFLIGFDVDPADLGGEVLPFDSWLCTRMFALDDTAKYLEVQFAAGGSSVLSILTLYGLETIDFYFQQYPPASATDLFWTLPIIEVSEVGSPSPTEPIGNVWTGIMTWITSALTSVMGAFYVDGSLTLLGTLACIGVSVGIGFLLIGLLQRFLKLRG